MATIKERLSNKTTPSFFKKLRNWSATVGVILLIVSKVPLVPEWIRQIAEILGAALSGGAITSHLTVK